MATRQEKIRYKGSSIDQYMGAEGTFWYSKNIDIRNDLKGIQLLSNKEERSSGGSRISVYVKFDFNTLVRLHTNGDITIGNNLSFGETLIGNLGIGFPQSAVKFRDYVYVFTFTNIKRFTIVAGVLSGLLDITPAGRPSVSGSSLDVFPVISFWNSALLVGNKNQLRRGLPTTNTGPIPVGGRKSVRTFGDVDIRGIVGRSSNIEVYVDYNGLDSRIYYIGGFRDAVDTGISNTVILSNLSIFQVGQIGERTFVVCKDKTNNEKYSLYEVAGYNTRLIKQSYLNNGNNNYHKDFQSFFSASQEYPVDGKILFLPFLDQIRSYGRETDDIGDSLCALWDGGDFSASVAFGNYLYCSTSSLLERRYNLLFRHNNYINEDGILISRIFDGVMMGLRKQLLSVYIGYKLDMTGVVGPDTSGTIEIFIRTDMDAFNVDGGRISLVVISDPTKMREVIETQQIINVGIDDFSTIQYKVEIHPGTVNSVSPILYELTFNYDDQIQQVS